MHELQSRDTSLHIRIGRSRSSWAAIITHARHIASSFSAIVRYNEAGDAALGLTACRCQRDAAADAMKAYELDDARCRK